VDGSPIGKAVRGLAAVVAMAGGAVLIVVTATTVLSIVGRILIPLGLKPIQGDVEIVQAGMLFAILCFLPWAHLTRGHAIVAILTDRFPTRFNAFLEFLMDVLMLAVAVFIIWRFQAGLFDKIANRETSFILRYPIWWSYAAGLIGLVTFVIVSAYCAVRSGRNAFSANPVRPLSEMGE
jgi:TRAP-type C4-dicarboxylate transport system permease small subunit